MKLRPWLLLPTALAHDVAPFFLKLYGSRHQFQTLTWRPMEWRGLHFTNRLGVAAGVDKNATQIQDWWTLGVGFIEIGTVTPLPQKPNPGKILARNVKHEALWNKMGFPSDGAKIIKKRLQSLDHPHFTPIFVNIGKNRQTPNEKAAEDYVKLIDRFWDVADAFVVNISSPNTKGLRDLQSKESLRLLLATIFESMVKVMVKKASQLAADAAAPDITATTPPNPADEAGSLTKTVLRPALQGSKVSMLPPVLLKLSPDLTDEELADALEVSGQEGIDGWILSNSTQARPEGLAFEKEGGLSGRPLAAHSKHLLLRAQSHLGPTGRQGRLLVSCGGVMSPEDVYERLSLGADLVQVYSALIYRGPFFFQQTSEWMNLSGHS